MNQNTLLNQNTQINQHIQPNEQKTFANITKKTQFPNKKEAIIIITTQEIPIEDYVYKIGDLIGPNNIKYVSKLSKDRLCIFLTSKELVDKLTTEYHTVIIKNQTVQIRKYINPALRIIISNACPSIPHSVIENTLKEAGIKLVSPITFLRAGLSREEYKHILSFRRQAYLAQSEEPQDMPNSLLITHEETNYRIFISTDTTCFACKQKGHMANKCPNKAENTTTHAKQPQETENTLTQTTQEKDSENNTTITTAIIHEIPDKILHTKTTINIQKPIKQMEEKTKTNKTKAEKRINTSTSSLEDEILAATSQESTVKTLHSQKQEKGNANTNIILSEKTKPKQKKKRSNSPNLDSQKTLEEIMVPLRTEIEQNKDLYKLSYDELFEFLNEAQGSTDPLQIAKQYTPDIPSLLFVLKDLHPHLTDRSAKQKFTRLTNRMRDQLSEEIANSSCTSE